MFSVFPLKSYVRFTTVSTQRMLQLTFVAGGVAACILAIRGAVIVGYARSLAGDSKPNLSLVDQAVRISPDDPELYIARAKSAATQGEIDGAVADLQEAIVLRPRDYKLWIQLGRLLEKNDRDDAAFNAFSKAETLAPFYAIPHWEKAKVLQKLRQEDDAFAEYRKATLANPRLFDQVIETAWKAFGPDVKRTQAAVDPRSDSEKLIFAQFLIYHDKAVEALPVIQSIADLSLYDRRQLLRYLIGQKQFTVAYALWVDGPWKVDGGFESGRISDDAGFAWTDGRAAATKVSIDDSVHLSGNHSLRIEWTGGPAPAENVISLLVPVDPNADYRLSFAARSQDVLSGVAPVVRVSDANKIEGTWPQVDLPVGTTDWQQLGLAFKTGPSTNTIRISLQKQRCKDAVCPIFGTQWLDDFAVSNARDN